MVTEGGRQSILDASQASQAYGLKAIYAEQAMKGFGMASRKSPLSTNVPAVSAERRSKTKVQMHPWMQGTKHDPFGNVQSSEQCFRCNGEKSDPQHMLVPTAGKPSIVGFKVGERVLALVDPASLNESDRWELGTVVEQKRAFDGLPSTVFVDLDEQGTLTLAMNEVRRAPMVPKFRTPEEADAWMEAASGDRETGRPSSPSTQAVYANGAKARPPVDLSGVILTGRLVSARGFLSDPFAVKQTGPGLAGTWQSPNDSKHTFTGARLYGDLRGGPVELAHQTLEAPVSVFNAGDTISVTFSAPPLVT